MEILDKLSKLPLGTIVDTSRGKLKQIIVDQVESMERPLAHLLPEMTGNLFGPVCILIYLFVLDWRMALLSLVSIPVGMLFMMLVMIGYGEKYAGSVRTAQEMNFMDSLAKIGTIVGTVDEILNQKRHADGCFRQKGLQERKHKGHYF